MDDAVWGIVGAVAGSAVSLIGTLLALRHSRKLSIESDSRRFEYETKEWLRNEKVQLYCDFAGLLEDITFPITMEDERFLIDKEVFECSMNKINDYLNENSGKYAFFLPFTIQKQIEILRSEIYSIVSKDENRLIHDLADIPNHKAMKAIKKAKTIISLMQEDIGIKL